MTRRFLNYFFAYLFKMHFFLLTFTASGYSNNQREAILLQNVEVAKAKF
jgi:hypothetical protein